MCLRPSFKHESTHFHDLFVYCFDLFLLVRIAWFTCWTGTSTQSVRKQRPPGQISASLLQMFFHFTAESVVLHHDAPPQNNAYSWSLSPTGTCWLTLCVSSGLLLFVMAIYCLLVLIISSCTKIHWVRNLFPPKPSLDSERWHVFVMVSRGVLPRKGRRVVCVGPYCMNRWCLDAARRLQFGVHRNESLPWNLSGLTRMLWWAGCWRLSSRAGMTTSWHQHICCACASNTQLIHFHLAASVNYCWKLPRGFKP